MIELESLKKSFDRGETWAVNGISLRVEAGETLVLLGTSGSGKTTTMKMVNRLVEPTAGRIAVNGKDIREQDPIELRRGIGYAIQHIGLLPHMTVAQNVAIVPSLLGWARKRIDARVEELLGMVGLEPSDFRDRFPNQLSGGQKQRIGVARALAADPPIVLMDEPFGALDPITREQLQNEFLELETEIQKTILFVTHDIFEAVKMGDRIALLDEGKLRQLATPRELVEHPADEFVDAFLGQHRFQLALLTRTVGTMAEHVDTDAEAPPQRPRVYLPARSSLIDALDLYKRTGQNRIPIYRGKQFVGQLTHAALLRAITSVFQETGDSA
jgi:osmoprotectant transport system ATP-binding protein